MEHIKFQSQEINAITPKTFFGRNRGGDKSSEGPINLIDIWERQEEREHHIREKENAAIVEAERLHEERVKKIREETRRQLECPPDPPALTESPRESTGKISDVATFLTDLLKKYDVKEYIGTIQQWYNSLNVAFP